MTLSILLQTFPAATNRCGCCARPLNQACDPTTQDLGGDCLRCMAVVGDPDAVQFYITFYEEHKHGGPLPPAIGTSRRASPRAHTHMLSYMTSRGYLVALCGQSNVGGHPMNIRATATGITCAGCLGIIATS